MHKENYKVLEKITQGENLWDLGLNKEFVDLIAKAWTMKGKADKSDFIKIYNIFSMKDSLKKFPAGRNCKWHSW